MQLRSGRGRRTYDLENAPNPRRLEFGGSVPSVVELMDTGTGTDVVMVDQASGPNTNIPARYYAAGGPYRRRKKRVTRRRYAGSNAGYRVYKPMNLIAGRIRGRGDYWEDFKTNLGKGAKWARAAGRAIIPAGSFSTIGAVGGNAFGPVGSAIGGGLGNMMSRLVGFGDYGVVTNTVMDHARKMNMGAPVPYFGNISNGTIIQHREYIQDIVGTGSTDFSLTAYSINPGQVGTFPWLSSIASNYEQYELRGCVFQYKSLCSDSTTGAATALGAVTLATDYDSIEGPFGSKSQMEQSQYCTSGKPSDDILHPIECAPNRTSVPINYVRTGAVPPTADIRLYDMGKFQLALSGIPALSAPTGSLLGELWVTYEVALYKPVQGTGVQLAAHFGGTGAVFATGSPLTTTAVPAKPGSNLNVVCNGAQDRLEFAPGLSPGPYMVQVVWVGSATLNATAMSVTLSPGLTALSNLANGAGSQTSGPGAAQTSSVYNHIVSFNVVTETTALETITYSSTGTVPGAGSFFDLFVYKLPSLLIT